MGQTISLSSVIFRAVCPVCGKGKLYSGLLEVAKECSVCGAALGKHDAADGPAFFVMTIVSVVVILAAMVLEVAVSPPLWVHLLVWAPVIVGLSALMLRWCKAWMIAMEYRKHPRGFENREQDGAE